MTTQLTERAMPAITDRLARLDQLSSTLRSIALRAVAESEDRGDFHRSCAYLSARWCYTHIMARAERLAERNAPSDVLQAVRDAVSLVEMFAFRRRWTDADIHTAKLALALANRGRL